MAICRDVNASTSLLKPRVVNPDACTALLLFQRLIILCNPRVQSLCICLNLVCVTGLMIFDGLGLYSVRPRMNKEPLMLQHVPIAQTNSAAHGLQRNFQDNPFRPLPCVTHVILVTLIFNLIRVRDLVPFEIMKKRRQPGSLLRKLLYKANHRLRARPIINRSIQPVQIANPIAAGTRIRGQLTNGRTSWRGEVLRENFFHALMKLLQSHRRGHVVRIDFR